MIKFLTLYKFNLIDIFTCVLCGVLFGSSQYIIGLLVFILGINLSSFLEIWQKIKTLENEHKSR